MIALVQVRAKVHVFGGAPGPKKLGFLQPPGVLHANSSDGRPPELGPALTPPVTDVLE